MSYDHTTITRHDSSSTLTRRAAIRAVGGGAAALLVAATVGVAGATHTSQRYTVSTNANFRTGPSTSDGIIAVISKGNTFALTGQTRNGYSGIIYNGRSGWVLTSLVIQAAGSSTPVISGSAWTAGYVNLRSGPSTSHQILRVVPKGSQIGTSTTVQNGFRYVTHQGLAGWMATGFISATNPDDQGTNYKTTTTRLNLRAAPSTSAKVLTVIPAGATVQVLHTGVGQFVNVNYGGYQGWVAVAYLA